MNSGLKYSALEQLTIWVLLIRAYLFIKSLKIYNIWGL